MSPVAKILHRAITIGKSMRRKLSGTTLTLQGGQKPTLRFVQRASRTAFPGHGRQFRTLVTRRRLRWKPSGEILVKSPLPRSQIRDDSEELRTEPRNPFRPSLFLLHDGRGSYDAAPISLIRPQTGARIAEIAGRK